MFTINEKNEIINLAQHRKIRIRKPHNSNKYLIVAYIDKTQGQQIDGVDLDVLATFNEEIDANYSLCNLYCTIEAGKPTWNPHSISSFSDLWEKAKKKIPSVAGVPQASLEELRLSISGLRKITIAYARRGASGGGPLGLSEEQPVAETLKTVLEAEEPNGAEWTIDFQDVEDQS